MPPYLKDKAESFSDNIVRNTPNGLIALNEKLEVQQINRAALKMLSLRSASDVLGDQVVRILDPKDFLDVLNKGRNLHNKRAYLAEYEKYVELSIIHDREYHLLLCIMRDVTEEENAKQRQGKHQPADSRNCRQCGGQTNAHRTRDRLAAGRDGRPRPKLRFPS